MKKEFKTLFHLNNDLIFCILLSFSTKHSSSIKLSSLGIMALFFIRPLKLSTTIASVKVTLQASFLYIVWGFIKAPVLPEKSTFVHNAPSKLPINSTHYILY